MDAVLLRQVCIKHRFFEGGTNAQYSKLFEYNSTYPYDLRGLATIIWLCTSDTTFTISGIMQILAEAIQNG